MRRRFAVLLVWKVDRFGRPLRCVGTTLADLSWALVPTASVAAGCVKASRGEWCA